ncbi:coiled-coil domain-containing protein 126 [Nelusetta ayraudi]|uniref:coiled-coil domain-containing protein 126 n=1 Tax=Nelusetta ayraudi TaxID=303726 RepID=UPI003F7217A2
MLGALLRRNMSQKLSVLLLLFGLAWGLMLLRYTVQQPRHQSSSELREQILQLSRQYVRVLTEENHNALGGPQGTSMAGYADLKRTIAVLLDDILTRLVKLEGKLESVVNVSSANTSQAAGGILLSSAMAALQKPLKQEMPGSRPGGMSRLHKHILQRPHQ